LPALASGDRLAELALAPRLRAGDVLLHNLSGQGNPGSVSPAADVAPLLVNRDRRLALLARLAHVRNQRPKVVPAHGSLPSKRFTSDRERTHGRATDQALRSRRRRERRSPSTRGSAQP